MREFFVKNSTKQIIQKIASIGLSCLTLLPFTTEKFTAIPPSEEIIKMQNEESISTTAGLVYSLEENRFDQNWHIGKNEAVLVAVLGSNVPQELSSQQLYEYFKNNLYKRFNPLKRLSLQETLSKFPNSMLLVLLFNKEKATRKSTLSLLSRLSGDSLYKLLNKQSNTLSLIQIGYGYLPYEDFSLAEKYSVSKKLKPERDAFCRIIREMKDKEGKKDKFKIKLFKKYACDCDIIYFFGIPERGLIVSLPKTIKLIAGCGSAKCTAVILNSFLDNILWESIENSYVLREKECANNAIDTINTLLTEIVRKDPFSKYVDLCFCFGKYIDEGCACFIADGYQDDQGEKLKLKKNNCVDPADCAIMSANGDIFKWLGILTKAWEFQDSDIAERFKSLTSALSDLFEEAGIMYSVEINEAGRVHCYHS